MSGFYPGSSIKSDMAFRPVETDAEMIRNTEVHRGTTELDAVSPPRIRNNDPLDWWKDNENYAKKSKSVMKSKKSGAVMAIHPYLHK
jgi:hypothetical protein